MATGDTVQRDLGEAQRRAAAERAVEEVRDGMVLGFGSGRAAAYALEVLAGRMRQGLRIVGVPSSSTTEAKARALGLPLTTLDEHPSLDLTIDGADEVDPQRRLLKGGGGALLREKVLAVASARLVIVVEERKLVTHLGATRGVPLEVVPFAVAACARHLRALGGTPVLRRQATITAEGKQTSAITDNGNWLVDCTFPPEQLDHAEELDARLHAIPGIVETGLFVGLHPTVYAGTSNGVRVLNEA